MITISNCEVYGLEAAIRGMRNPMNSWDKSDTIFGFFSSQVDIGGNDLALMQKLVLAGDDHAKFLRFITVTLDITAPLYWWKQFDQYKVGTITNSCSTMHKIHAKEFTLDDFSHEHLCGDTEHRDIDEPVGILNIVIDALNCARNDYLETKDKIYWWQMIQLLPSSYNQTRTVQLNYQVLKSMYFSRRNHKLDEWREFCLWCETLPYFKEIISE